MNESIFFESFMLNAGGIYMARQMLVQREQDCKIP
jgi:hypothetical protein